MEQELDYAQMLEIPVSTVNVVKKKSIFKHNKKKAEENAPQDDLKDLLIESVNERVGSYVTTEDLSDPPAEENKKVKFGKDKGGIVIVCELVAVCLIAVGIFLTNIFMPNSAINTFIASFSKKQDRPEPVYSECILSPVTSQLSGTEVSVTEGVLCFTGKAAVYPVCDGKITSVSQEDGLYTVQIAHTSTFSSVITGLTEVYGKYGESVRSNLPFAYSDGANQVKVSLYDGETMLKCYSLSGAVPVWNS